ncbi:hypothetical protein JOM56_010490 [Amanita muscaria]
MKEVMISNKGRGTREIELHFSSFMSRGDRVVAGGNLSLSMRANYGEHGVDEYYKKVGATYRNPLYPGVRLCLFSWLSRRWWQNEKGHLTSVDARDRILLFDLACVCIKIKRSKITHKLYSGEVTVAFTEWWKLGKDLHRQETSQDRNENENQRTPKSLNPQRKNTTPLIPLGQEFPSPIVMAADPYTSEAFAERTGLACDMISFKDVAEGCLPCTVTDLSRQGGQADREDMEIEMVVCSFALHLIESSSELFALLWQLSTRARWLVVIAPHKKPEV